MLGKYKAVLALLLLIILVPLTLLMLSLIHIYLRNESKSPQQCAGVSVSAQPARKSRVITL